MLAYSLFQYFATLNNKELQINIIVNILDYSKDIFQNKRIDNSRFYELIPLAYIYFLFYQKTDIEDLKNIVLSFLDKVVYQKDNMKDELNSLITNDIKRLLAIGLMLTSILSDVKSECVILM